MKFYDMEVVTAEMVAYWHPKEWKTFLNWMAGQTCLMLPTGEGAYYLSDYRRWRAGLPVID